MSRLSRLVCNMLIFFFFFVSKNSATGAAELERCLGNLDDRLFVLNTHSRGRIPREKLLQEVFTDVLQLIPDQIDDSSLYHESFCQACAYGTPAIMLLYLRRGYEIDTVNQHGETGLMRAAYAGNKSTIPHLLKKGASVTLRDSDGNSALDHARMLRQQENVFTIIISDSATSRFGIRTFMECTQLIQAKISEQEGELEA